ncbi:MAG: SprT-like domain-containing protein [Bacteroidales bacterium]|nr:SprT-like domain-containing protein [Bacteroidales bacterium]
MTKTPEVKATVPYIEARFDEFNRTIFGDKLPKIPIALSNAASYVGLCTFKTRRRPFRAPEYYGFKLRISTRFDLPEAELEDTVIHEMIHYYIRLNGIKDTSAHGKVFRQIMDEINTRYGRHITISHRTTKEQREALIDKRPKWHVVAIVTFKNGRQGLKLLPRIVQRITAYHRALMGSGKITGIEYYFESDPWFNRFPTSSAFNVFFTPMDEVRAHISGRHPLTVTARSVSLPEP